MDNPSRTILDFNYKGDIQPILEKWAVENSFHTRDGGEGITECQRGGGILMCPILVQIKKSGDSVHLESWLDVDLLTQFTSLFMAPTQSAIDSSSTRLWREREIARLHINRLLKELGQPPIT